MKRKVCMGLSIFLSVYMLSPVNSFTSFATDYSIEISDNSKDIMGQLEQTNESQENLSDSTQVLGEENEKQTNMCEQSECVVDEKTDIQNDTSTYATIGFQNTSEGLVYLDETGQRVIGWIEIGDKKYFAASNGVLYQNQIITFGDIWYYMGADGSVQHGVINTNGKYYFADLNTGIIEKKAGWIEYNGKKYYAANGGVLYRNQIISFGDTWYYMGFDGSGQHGVVNVSGKYYFADLNTGIIEKKAGWIEYNGKKYYAAKGGVLYRNQIIGFGDTWYYMGTDGSVQHGVVNINGKYYFADLKTGIIVKKAGWLECNGKKYFAAKGGVLYRNQTISFGDTRYCMGADGSAQCGLVKMGGKIYYTDATTGIVIKKAGWLEQNGKRYFVNAEGVLYQNQMISFGNRWYYMGADGSVQHGVVNVNGKYYFADLNTGIIVKQAGWIEYNGKKYFAAQGGVLYRNQFISFGSIYYYCGNDAAIVTGRNAIGGVLYNFDAQGVMKKEGGWGTYNGNKYYKNPETGFPYKNQWVTFGDTHYYANAQGFMVSGWQTIGGYKYYFYPSTRIMARNKVIDGMYIGFDGRVVQYRDRMSVFSTVSTNTSNGTYNMSKALRSFNQVVIHPGQTLSFFSVAGPCGKDQGYLSAGVVGGTGYGGGICQASTTLYGAALRAGLTIVQRRNHSEPSKYVPIGQDAMVSYGSSDLKIRNDYAYPVKLITYVRGKTLYAEVWGIQPSWYDYIDVSSWKTGRRSAAACRQYIKNGRVVKTEQLSSSYYRK